MLTVAESSLVIVPVAVVPDAEIVMLRVLEFILLNPTVKVSSSSTFVSPFTEIVTVCVVSPAAKVKVPELEL